MNVAPISEKTIKPDFQGKKKKEQDFDAAVEKQEETYTKSKVNGMVLATASGKAGWLFAGFAAMTAIGAALMSSDKTEQQKNIA